ncbi:MAG: hypothetical protein EOS57_25650 [Mesorhizobium sp.]|nr:MAG: hypothetical protein EOS57_25650 [Mesorhizobium sp.]RWF52053.1 MAG: hypothetical protein EOS50_26095 [Mesorhizobium sp.]
MGLVDFNTLLFDPVYTVLGEAATLTLDDTAGTTADLSAIDETAGVEVLEGPSIATIRPAATVRTSELAEKGIAVADLANAALTLNGKDWTVISHHYLPTPKGEVQAQIRLILEES